MAVQDDFRTALQQHEGRLSDADRRLVEELLSKPDEAPFLSADELSSRAAVHPATVVRLAQKLGFRGYPQLRAALQRELKERIGPAERVRRRLEGAEGDGLLGRLVADEIAALAELPHQLGQEELDEAARILAGARRVFLFGQFHATVLVELLDRRLRRSGFDTVVLAGQGRELAERALSLRREDAVLAVAFRRRPPGLAALLAHADELRAESVVVSDTVGPLLRPRPTRLLTAARGGTDADFQSLTVPMAICNALVLTIAQRDAGRSIDALDRLGRLIERFSEEEEHL
jgi:DNA-binding MurR/RpiR family transcriptional regulator